MILDKDILKRRCGYIGELFAYEIGEKPDMAKQLIHISPMPP